MSYHIDLSHPSSSLPPFRVVAAWVDAPQYLKEIPISLQRKRVKTWAQSQSPQRSNHVTTIDLLPDEILLEILDYVRIYGVRWQVLVHVCCRWRQIVFASPRRLDLRLLCTNGTCVKEYLACWPAFPIVVQYECLRNSTPDVEEDAFQGIVAALEHRGRIHQIQLSLPTSLWSKITASMQEPFPALTSLSITSNGNVPYVPIGFIGRSAPRLQNMDATIPFFVLPILISFKSDLVDLNISDYNTPRADFMSPTALAILLAALSKLETLIISLPTWAPSVDDRWQTDFPNTTVVFPALTTFALISERTYLEIFMGQIDIPGLSWIDMTFLDLLDSRIPQFAEFLNCSRLKPAMFEDARICFDNRDMVFIDLNYGPDDIPFSIHISSWEGTTHKAWCMAQVTRQISGMLSNIGHLVIATERCCSIDEDCSDSGEDDDEDDDDEDLDEDIDWLELLRPFTAVETMSVCERLAKSVARALEDMPPETETSDQVLPALKLLILGGDPTTFPYHVFSSLQGRDLPVVIRIEMSEFESG